jgi:hypothetical protein
MRLFIGILFAVVGGLVAVIGLLGALNELVGMYSSALNDALADGPEAKAVGANMLRWAITGAAGVPFLVIGTVLLKISLFQKVRKMARGNAAAVQRPTIGASQWDAPSVAKGPGVPKPKPREKSERDRSGESGGSKSER